MDLDPILKSSLKLLHSTSIESGEKIRIALDEILKQKFGSSKMILNSLSKKYLVEEKNPPGTMKETKLIVEDTIEIDADDADIKDSTAILNALKSADTLANTAEEENLTEFGDLVCVVCSGIGITAGNRLVECCECHSLYHQECHKIKISNDDANEDTWSCNNCKKKLEHASEITKIPSKSPSPSLTPSDYKNLEALNSSKTTTRKSSSHSVAKQETHAKKHSSGSEKKSSSRKRSKHHDSRRKK